MPRCAAGAAMNGCCLSVGSNTTRSHQGGQGGTTTAMLQPLGVGFYKGNDQGGLQLAIDVGYRSRGFTAAA